MKKQAPVAEPEFIPAEEYQEADAEAELQEMVVTDWESNMQVLASQDTNRRLVVPRSGDLSRKQVVNAFMNAFELIGGTPRLALWAHENPSSFYKLYSRLLPSQASQALGETNEIIVKHVIPRGALD